MPKQHFAERQETAQNGLAADNHRAARLGLAILLVAAAVPAMAHKLSLFTYVDGGEVFVEGYFADGNKARNSAVTVLNEARETVAQGTTDSEGRFQFAVPPNTATLRIVLNAGMGHQAEYELTGDDLGSRATAADTTPSGLNSAAPAAAEAAAEIVAAAGEAPAADAAAVHAAVRQAVIDAVRPLALEIDKLRERTRFSDILGGIGFIVGLLGVWAYSKSRPKKGA
jgi:nickel transport protein